MKGNYAKEKTKTNSIIKKLIFILVVVTMLAGDFILPIKLWSIAKEYEDLQKSITVNASSNANENENANGSEGNSANDAENEASKANESNITAEKSEDDAKKGDASSVNEENEGSSAIKENSADSGNGENDTKGSNNIECTAENNEETNTAKETIYEEANTTKGNVDEETDATKGSVGNGNINTSLENNQTSSDIKRSAPVGLLNTNNSLSLQKGANNTEPEKTLEELDSEIKATSKETINERKQNNTYKTKNNLYEIRTFKTQILSGAKNDENGNLVWNATSSASGHEFTFRVNYALSGYGEIPEGAFRITIPKQILRDRNGALADSYMLSLPTLAECKEEGKIAELIYKEDEDYLVIYNPAPVDAGLNGYFEISYVTNTATYNYKDYNPANTGLVKNGGTASDEFYAILELNVDKDTDNSEKDILNNSTEDKNVFINTKVELKSTQKRYPSLYREWNSSWMANIPEDNNNYYYLVWEISSNIGDVTQKYNFKLDDFVTSLTDGTVPEDYELVGYKLSGEKYFSNKNIAENQILSGIRYDYVLTRHKRETFGGITYKLKNTVIATIHPIDEIDSDSTATSSNTFNWDPEFIPPAGSLNNFKYGNNTGFGGKYANYDLEKLQSGEVSSLNNFKYKTITVGYAYPWTLRDGGNVNVPEDYGVNNINYDTWDDLLFLEDDENPMNTADYYLDYFTYSVQNKDAQFDDFYNKFSEIPAVYADDEVLTFYAKFGDRETAEGNEWVQIGIYNLKTGEINVTNENVQEMTCDKVTFKEGAHATGWRFFTTNKHYFTNITVSPCYVLTNSNYVMQKIENKSSIKIQNNVVTNISNHNGIVIFQKQECAYDYARVTYYDSNISKIV